MNEGRVNTVQTQETAPNKKLTRPRGEKGQRRLALAQERANKLKAERVQEKLAAERFSKRLQTLPGWNLTEDLQALFRQRHFPDAAAAASFALHAVQLALGRGQGLSLSASPGQMLVLLHGTPRGRGYRLAEETLELAGQLG